MRNRLRSVLTASGIVLAAFLSIATSKPKGDSATEAVDPETAKYIGDWEGENVTLSISQDKTFAYKKQDGATSKSVNGKLKAIEGNQIVVRVAIVDMKFKVDSPPTETDGTWEMTVDGVELTKKGAGAGKGASVKTKLEGSIATQFGAKGVSKVVCPNPTGQSSFTCTATLKNAKTTPVQVTLKDPAKHSYGFTINVYDGDATALATVLASALEKETKGKLKLTVDCGTGKVYIPDNDAMTCTGVDPKTKRKGTVEASYSGNDLHAHAKGF